MVIMNQKDCAEYIGTTVKSLNSMRSQGKINIPYFKIGKKIKFDKDAVDMWINEQKHKTKIGL